MNTLRNSVRLVGNLGMDPEIKTFDTNKRLARVSLATSESYKNDKGEKVTETQWHNLVAWDKPAELIEKYCNKGAEIAIEGKLVNRNYVDKEGLKRYVTEVQVSELVLLGTRS